MTTFFAIYLVVTSGALILIGFSFFNLNGNDLVSLVELSSSDGDRDLGLAGLKDKQTF